MPVTFPPGCAELSTSFAPIGSAIATMTIGILLVARFTAATAGVLQAMIRSTFERRVLRQLVEVTGSSSQRRLDHCVANPCSRRPAFSSSRKPATVAAVLAQEADPRNLPRLLRARPDRPAGYGAPPGGDNLPPVLRSPRQGGRAPRTDVEPERPRLMTSSKVVGWRTGMSVSFSPFRMRSA